jgi:hypothetical protein
VAAALSGAAPLNGPTVAIVSGGNMSMEKLEEFRRTRGFHL